MVKKIIQRFEIEYLQILDENGNCDESLMPKLSAEEIKKIYELMILSRKFDEKCIILQRQGRMGTYGSVLGQEASQVASAITLKDEDWLFPTFRESSALIARNTPITNIMLYWAGDERGSNFSKDLNNFPICIPVGTQIPHAVGVAWAAKIKNQKIAVLCYLGDGATSEGDFHESLNFAGVFKAPVVFLCQNNQYAISFPRSNQTASQTLAQKAIAYGFNGIMVDGNDVFAVYKATKEAIEKARSGNGPTLIECFTYRMSDHTTADDATRYRSKEEVEEWKRKDPIDRLRKYMQNKKIWNEDYENKIINDATKKVEDAVKEIESMPLPKPEDIFTYTFKDMPDILKEELDELKESLREEK